MINHRSVLILAPHTDDGELGCGGTIARFIDEGSDVFYVAFSTAEQSIPDGFKRGVLKTEVKTATSVLGIKPGNLIVFDYEVRKLNYFRQELLDELVKIKKKINPDLVFLPCLHDIHQDHTTVAQEGLRAFKGTSILGYELIWNNLTFDTTCFIRLEKKHVELKAKALKHYVSQSKRDYTSEDFIFSLAKTRGVQIGSKYAEAFEVIRWIV